MKCSVCDKEVRNLRRGMCPQHYNAWRNEQKKNGAMIGRKYSIDFDFLNWSREKAWVLGVILGDGHVLSNACLTSAGNRRSYRVAITCGDKDVIEKCIKIISPQNKYIFQKGTYRVCFYSKDFARYCGDFLKIDGKKQEEIPYPSIPHEYESDFIRGLVDSDGHIGDHEGRFFIGMKAPHVIKGVADFFEKNGFLENKNFSIRKNGVKTEIRFLNREESIKALDCLYKNSLDSIRCHRKFKEYESSSYKLFSSDTMWSKKEQKGYCLVCGQTIFSRGFCEKHYSKQARDWMKYLPVDEKMLLQSMEKKDWQSIDWGIKAIVKSYYKASFNLMMSPHDYIKIHGIEGVDEKNIREKISEVRKNFRVGTVSWFSVRLAYEYLKKYVSCNDVIFDPFMGWGARMVAARMLGCRYIGFDLNTSLISELKLLAEKIGISTDGIHYRNSGIVSNYDDIGPFDFFITSPPYWVKEYYCDDIGQPQYFLDYQDFKENLIEKCFEQTASRSKKGGIVFCKNLNVEGKMYNMADDIENVLRRFGHVTRQESVWKQHTIRKSPQVDCILTLIKS